MIVPLILDLVTMDGKQFLKFWRNGEYELIQSPIRPFCYCRTDPPSNAQTEVVSKILLYSPGREQELIKCSFNTVKELKDSIGDMPGFYESKFNFKDRVYSCLPKLVRKQANTKPLKVMCLDFEMDTYGRFPTPKENAIIAAGIQFFKWDKLSFEEGPIELIEAKTYNDDKPLLEALLKRIEEEDPDVFAVFNGVGFDFPYMFERMQINHMDIRRLSRDGSTPWINNSLMRKEIKLGGRIIYDEFYRSVDRDQNLFKWSPPNRQMKTVAKLYGLEDVVQEPPDVMGNMRAMVGTDELKRYLSSDIRCTKFLFDIYFREIVNMSETLGVSLESCVNSTASYIGNMLFAREYEKMNIISDMTVGEAYPEESENKQGADVGCFRPGLYKHGLKKKDVQSYYPNLVRTLNLSPETCHILDVKNGIYDYKATMDHNKKYLTLEIPDEKMNKQIIIGIDFSYRGFASGFVDKAMTDRLAMKNKMESLDEKSPEYADLDVNQLGLKVIMNSITGYFGQKYSAYGSLACYIAITGTGRFIIGKLIDFLNANEPGRGVIALDTDGVVTDDTISEEDTNIWLEKYILDFFRVPKNYIKIELDKFEAAFFRDKAKQYMLIEKDKKGNLHLVIHGISFKGSSLPKLFSTIIQEFGFKMLMLDDNDPGKIKQFEEEIAGAYNKDTWNLSQISKRLNCKPISQYKSANTLGGQLVKQYEQRFKTKITTETQLSYVKVKQKGSTYRLMTIFDHLEDVTNLDLTYYESIVDDAFERLGLQDRTPKGKKAIKEAKKQKSLFDFQ